MKNYKIYKPNETIYSDFTFNNQHLFAIFEMSDGRIKKTKVCKTDITNETWIIRDNLGKITGFMGDIKETDELFLITLNK